MVSGETNVKEEIGEARVSLRNYRKKFHYMLAKKAYEKNDVLVHNKLIKRTYEGSKGTYDGFGKARKNASILASRIRRGVEVGSKKNAGEEIYNRSW